MDVRKNLCHTDSFASAKVFTPLHAEFQSLNWVMTVIRQLDYTCMRFETDCLEQVKLIGEDEEWPLLASKYLKLHVLLLLIYLLFLFFVFQTSVLMFFLNKLGYAIIPFPM